jgi:hypothetical protein
MAFEAYKKLVGKLNSKILTDMIIYSEELSIEQREELFAMIDKIKKA